MADAEWGCGGTGSTATSTRSARTATPSDPDRPLETVRRLSGWLVERDGRIWLERGLPRPRAGHARSTTSRRRSCATWSSGPRRPSGTCPTCAGNFDPGAVGLPARAAGDADPAHLHPAGRHHRPSATCAARPASPTPRPTARRRAAGRRAGQRRHPAVAGERPHRRAHALRRRADAVPAAGRAAARGGRAATSCGCWSTPTASGSPATTRCSTCSPSTASGSRSTCSTTACRPTPAGTTAAPTCAGSRSRRSSGCQRAGRSSPRSP